MKKSISSIKIMAVIVIIIIAFCLSACDIYTYEKAHIRINDVWIDVDVKEWYVCSNEQIKLVLTDGTKMIVNSKDCILYKGNLPTAR